VPEAKAISKNARMAKSPMVKNNNGNIKPFGKQVSDVIGGL